MLRSEEYKKHPDLFTSTTLAKAKIEDISMLLKMSCWQDERFKDLLTCTIVSKAKQMIKKMPVLIELAEEYQIDKNLTTGFLCFSPSQNYALIRFLEDSKRILIIDGKLNPVFGNAPTRLKSRYGIDLKELMKKYPYQEKEERKKSLI